MTEYRCYFLTADLRIGRAETIDAHDDAGAIEMAQLALDAERHCRAFELWCADQRVGSEFSDDVEQVGLVLQLASSGTSRSVG